MRKYEKPIVRGLNDVAIAVGALCTSGLIPTERCNTGGANVGPCDPVGGTAGRDCTPVGSAANLPTNCKPGSVVTDCSNGLFASVRMPQ
jgi:hypothetical protein